MKLIKKKEACTVTCTVVHVLYSLNLKQSENESVKEEKPQRRNPPFRRLGVRELSPKNNQSLDAPAWTTSFNRSLNKVSARDRRNA